MSTAFETSTTFPAVTICNLVPYDITKNLPFLSGILKENNFSLNITPTEASPGIYQLNQNVDFLKAIIQSNKTTYGLSFLRSLGFDINEILISCYFNKQRCTASDFKWAFSYEYGNCYTFNFLLANANSTAKTISNAGPAFGLVMELFAGIPGKLYSTESGFYVAVHNNSDMVMTSYTGNKISVGQATNIGVKRILTNKLNAPYSNCTIAFDSTATTTDFDIFTKSIVNGYYSKERCFEICLQKYFVLPACGCEDPSLFPYYINDAICYTVSDLNCTNNIRSKLSSLTQSCNDYCPIACALFTYETNLDSSAYPTNYYTEVLKLEPLVIKNFENYTTGPSGLPINTDLFKQSVAMVNIYYEQLGFTRYAESPAVTGDSLFGTVGKHVLLFMI